MVEIAFITTDRYFYWLFLKIVLKIIYDKLLGHWSNNNILADKESGFLKKITAENFNLWIN
jgi:hypothetical protein